MRYTPTTSQVRIAYDQERHRQTDQTYRDSSDEFQRWLDSVKAEAWDEGHSWGWADAQDAHDVRQSMARADWKLGTPNPYREEAPDA